MASERDIGDPAGRSRRLDGVTTSRATGGRQELPPDGPPAGEVDTLWTIPNLFTLLRLLCLPLFVWLLFGLPSRQAAAWLLGVLGATDWVDGYLARRLGQTSEFGKKFDPTVDRLMFVVAIVAIIINDAMPLWFGIAVLAREVLVGGTILVASIRPLAASDNRELWPVDATHKGRLIDHDAVGDGPGDGIISLMTLLDFIPNLDLFGFLL